MRMCLLANVNCIFLYNLICDLLDLQQGLDLTCLILTTVICDLHMCDLLPPLFYTLFLLLFYLEYDSEQLQLNNFPEGINKVFRL